MVSVNNSTCGAEAHLPFGGNGKSGNGSRQSGIWVLDQFTRWQAMNWDYSGRLQKAQMDVTDIAADPGSGSTQGEELGEALALTDGPGVGVGVGVGVVVVPPPLDCPATSWFACSISDWACSSSCW